MISIDLFVYSFLLNSNIFTLTMASNVTENKIKGMYYEHRQASENSILNSIISTHKDLR